MRVQQSGNGLWLILHPYTQTGTLYTFYTYGKTKAHIFALGKHNITHSRRVALDTHTHTRVGGRSNKNAES